MKWWLLFLPLDLHGQSTLSLPPIPPPVTFNIYQGREPVIYSNRVNVGYQSNGSNYFGSISVPKGTNYFAVAAKDRLTAWEGNYSSDFSLVSKTQSVVTLLWNWTNYPYAQKTVLVTLSFGSNSYSMTNATAKVQEYRLLGQTMTSAVVVASDNLGGPWMRITNAPTFTYPSQRTPDLIITRK